MIELLIFFGVITYFLFLCTRYFARVKESRNIHFITHGGEKDLSERTQLYLQEYARITGRHQTLRHEVELPLSAEKVIILCWIPYRKEEIPLERVKTLSEFYGENLLVFYIRTLDRDEILLENCNSIQVNLNDPKKYETLIRENINTFLNITSKEQYIGGLFKLCFKVFVVFLLYELLFSVIDPFRGNLGETNKNTQLLENQRVQEEAKTTYVLDSLVNLKVQETLNATLEQMKKNMSQEMVKFCEENELDNFRLFKNQINKRFYRIDSSLDECETKADNEEKIKKLKLVYDEKIKEMQSFYKENINELKSSCEGKIKELESSYNLKEKYLFSVPKEVKKILEKKSLS